MKASDDDAAELPSGPAKMTSIVPALPGGDVAVISVAVSTTKSLVKLPGPNATLVTSSVEPLVNPLPVMVTEVPPRVEPVFGLTDVTLGPPDADAGCAKAANAHATANAAITPRAATQRPLISWHHLCSEG